MSKIIHHTLLINLGVPMCRGTSSFPSKLASLLGPAYAWLARGHIPGNSRKNLLHHKKEIIYQRAHEQSNSEQSERSKSEPMANDLTVSLRERSTSEHSERSNSEPREPPHKPKTVKPNTVKPKTVKPKTLVRPRTTISHPQQHNH